MLSILMPTYNGDAYLAAQLESILSQSFADFELLVVDDGSTDATISLLERYGRQDTRIRILPSKENRGQPLRLQELLAAATHEYICISDQDDIWAPDKNERLLAGIGGMNVAFGRSELVDSEGTAFGCTALQALGISADPTMRLRTLFRPMVSAHAMIARRSWVQPNCFHGALPFDWALGLEALFSGGLAYVDDAIIYHRIHEKNQCNGDLGRVARQRVGSQSLRAAIFSHLPGRLHFWTTLDYLSRSSAIHPKLRGSFGRLALACKNAWFAEWRSWRGVGNVQLRHQIDTVMRPLAGSDADWRTFSEHADFLINHAFHPRNVIRGFRPLPTQ